MHKLIPTLLLTITFFVIQTAHGQTTGRKLYPGMTKTRGDATIPVTKSVAYRWTYFLSAGRTSYFGELCDGVDCVFRGFNQANPTVQLGLRYRFNMRLSLGASLRYANVGGSDVYFNEAGKARLSGRYERNLSFSTHVYELMVTGRFDLLPVITRFIGEKANQYDRRNIVVPYVFAGIGIIYFEPTAKLDNTYYNLRNRITSETKQNGNFYLPIAFVMNGGVGAQFKISEFFDVSLDLGITRTTTYYLDDVGPNEKYPTWNLNPAQAPSELDYKLADRHEEVGYNRVDPAASTNPYRGGRKSSFFTMDWYFTAQVGVHYTLSHPLKLKNPRHRHFKSGKGIKHHQFNSR